MDTEELTPAEAKRFAEYLESVAASARRCTAIVAKAWKSVDAEPPAESLAAVRKLNAQAMACDVVARKLRRLRSTPEPFTVDPGAKT